MTALDWISRLSQIAFDIAVIAYILKNWNRGKE